MNSERMKTFLSAFAGGVIAIALAHAVTALADGNPAIDQVPKLIPYQGTLEKDGTGVTGQVPMTFSLFDGSTATTAAWTEKQTVNVFAGRFLAMLGSTSATSATNLTKTLTNADDVYLAVTLNTAAGDVPLSNRQRFLPVPYALWTTAATNFNVGRDLTVGHAATVWSDLTVGGMSAGSEGNLWVGNAGGHTAIFNQEISGAPSLHLTSSSGVIVANVDLQVLGKARLGRTINQCSSANSCACSSGFPLGGGAACNGTDYLHASHPTAAGDGWYGECRDISSHSVTTTASTYVVCARVAAD